MENVIIPTLLLWMMPGSDNYVVMVYNVVYYIVSAGREVVSFLKLIIKNDWNNDLIVKPLSSVKFRCSDETMHDPAVSVLEEKTKNHFSHSKHGTMNLK